MAPELQDITNRKTKRRELKEHERVQVVSMLLGMSMLGRFRRGIFQEVAKKFSVHPRTVSRVWQQAVQSRSQGVVNIDEIRKAISDE